MELTFTLDLIILTSLQLDGSIIYHGLKFLVHGSEFNSLSISLIKWSNKFVGNSPRIV